jgi:hypothetical protein
MILGDKPLISEVGLSHPPSEVGSVSPSSCHDRGGGGQSHQVMTGIGESGLMLGLGSQSP